MPEPELKDLVVEMPTGTVYHDLDPTYGPDSPLYKALTKCGIMFGFESRPDARIIPREETTRDQPCLVCAKKKL